MIQAVIAPGMTAEQPALRRLLLDYRQNPELKSQPLEITAARTKEADGYVLEVLLPWKSIGVTPSVGVEVAFQMFADDRDSGEPFFHTVWYPAVGTFQDSKRTHRIRLAEKPSPPFAGLARGFQRLDDAWFSVVAAPRLIGKSVVVRFNNTQLAKGSMAEYGGRAFACLKARLPAGVDETARFEISVDGQTLDSVGLLDLESVRGERELPVQYGFRPFCFTGGKLPPGSFKDLAEIERLLGPHEVTVTYYDAAFNVVSNAAAPGRYQAVVDIVPRFHPPLRRFFILFRSAGRIDWSRLAMTGEATLFKEVPIWVFQGARDTAVLPECSRVMVESLRRISGRVRYTEYPDLGHNCWDTAYATPELYDWLLQQVRGKPQQVPAPAEPAPPAK